MLMSSTLYIIFARLYRADTAGGKTAKNRNFSAACLKRLLSDLLHAKLVRNGRFARFGEKETIYEIRRVVPADQYRNAGNQKPAGRPADGQ
jgi:hypothetical protein